MKIAIFKFTESVIRPATVTLAKGVTLSEAEDESAENKPS